MTGYRDDAKALASLMAKRRRTGECVVCGATTRYAGKGITHPNGASLKCASCAAVRWTDDAIIEAIQRWNREQGEPPVASDWRCPPSGYPSLGTVQNAFGSWRSGIAAAGFEPIKVGGRRRRAA